MAREGKSGRSSRLSDRKRVDRGEWAFAIAAVTLIYAAHYFYGALVTDVTMIVTLGFCGLLAWALASEPLRRGLVAADGLIAPAISFAALLVVSLLSLTPYLPGGPHPVWSFTGVGSPAVTIDKSSTIVEIVKLMALACIFAVGAVTGGSSRRGQAALLTMLVLGAAFALWAFLGTVAGLLPSGADHRVEAHFLNANTAGTLFGAFLLIGLSVLVDRRRRAPPGKVAMALAPIAAANLLFLVCLLMSGSRGGALATLTAAVFLLLALLLGGGGRLSRGTTIGFGVAAVGMVAVYFSGSLVAERLGEVGQAAVLRSSIWAEHWSAFQAAPLAGYGLGTSEFVNKAIMNTGSFEYLWNIRAILNVYLQWLEQAGVIGAALMFATIAFIVVATLRGLFRGTRAQLAVLGLLGVDIVFVLHGATDFALETPSMAMMWAYLLGLQLTLSQRSQVS